MARMLKLLVLSVITMLCTSVSQAEVLDMRVATQKGGDVTVSSWRVDREESMCKTEFSVISEQAGTYAIQFWVMPRYTASDEFECYDVNVNGSLLKDYIAPQRSGWHYATLSEGQTVCLQAGVNTVSVISRSGLAPRVSHIELSRADVAKKGINRAQVPSLYDAYIEKLSGAAATQVYSVTDSLDMPIRMARIEATDSAKYNFWHRRNVKYAYTYYEPRYYKAGQIMSVETEGINGFSHIFECFRADAPNKFSYSMLSGSNNSIHEELTIPVSGWYYIRLRSFVNGTAGLCAIKIDNQAVKDSVPVFSLGVRCKADGADISQYNAFTVTKPGQGDPMLSLESGNMIPGSILYYNDYYAGTDEFEWDVDVRLKYKHTNSDYAIILTGADSREPEGVCDLYLKCASFEPLYFTPRLHRDDAMLSSRASDRYNCVSWSGGITSFFEWPLWRSSSYCVVNPVNNEVNALASFDKFYNSRGLYRFPYTVKNPIVALWAHEDSLGERRYTHASVKGENGYVHGYDWESKLGALERIFHPEYSLGNLSPEGYGFIVEYYSYRDSAGQKSFMEQIADDELVIDYVDYDMNDKNILYENINNIDLGVVADYEKLFGEWEVIVSNTPYSNPDQIADCDQYRELLDFCELHPEVRNMVYAQLPNQHLSCIILANDLLQNATYPTVKELSGDVETRALSVFRPLYCNLISAAKEELGLPKKDSGAEAGTVALNVSSASHCITVSICSAIDATADICIMDLKGHVVAGKQVRCRIVQGDNEMVFHVDEPGNYLCAVEINGQLRVKKFKINN